MSNPSSENERDSRQAQMSFDEQVAHLSAGYANSQSVVRFLDTKAVAVLGVVPVVLGVLGAFFKWQLDVVPIIQMREEIGLCASIIACALILGLSIVLLALAWQTVHCVFGAILPRTPGDAKPSILFPYRAAGFEERLSQFLASPTQQDALDDYHRQLNRMGVIVAIKIERVSQAIRNLKCLFLFSAIAMILMIMIVVINSVVSLSNALPGTGLLAPL